MSGRGSRPSPRQRLRAESESPRWGWHRLSDHAAGLIVESANIRPGDLVVDVGAGEGALIRPLLAAGARVIAVELHPGRRETLRARFAGAPVTVVATDALWLRWPTQPFRVVANPPYAVCSAIIRRLLSPHSRLVSADLVLQRRVVRQILERHAAGAQQRGNGFVLQRGQTVPRTAFRPPPRVDSAVLMIRRRG